MTYIQLGHVRRSTKSWLAQTNADSRERGEVSIARYDLVHIPHISREVSHSLSYQQHPKDLRQCQCGQKQIPGFDDGMFRMGLDSSRLMGSSLAYTLDHTTTTRVFPRVLTAGERTPGLLRYRWLSCLWFHFTDPRLVHCLISLKTGVPRHYARAAAAIHVQHASCHEVGAAAL